MTRSHRYTAWILGAGLLAAAGPGHAASTLSADPNPVPIAGGSGTTTITWNTKKQNAGVVKVSKNGGPEQFVAQGKKGSVAQTLQKDDTFVYKLYNVPGTNVWAGPLTVTTKLALTVKPELLREKLEKPKFRPGTTPLLIGPDVSVEPHGTYAKFSISAKTDSFFKLRLFGAPVPPARHCDESLAVEAATFSWGYRKQWNAQILDLQPARTYVYEVCAKTENDVSSRASGTFKTHTRVVKVTFQSIHVTDDSDDLSAGDLKFHFFADGQGPKEYREDCDTNGTIHPNQVLTVSGAGKNVQLRVVGADDDADPGQFCGSFPGGTCWDDWGEAIRTVNVETSGTAEQETSSYTWAAAHHGLGFTVTAKVEVSYALTLVLQPAP